MNNCQKLAKIIYIVQKEKQSKALYKLMHSLSSCILDELFSKICSRVSSSQEPWDCSYWINCIVITWGQKTDM